MSGKTGRRPRSAEQFEQTRSKISAQALKLFQEEGYDAVSIRRLAGEVGCAPMTIYAHFDGKIEILKHLWAVVLGGVFKEIEANLKHIDAPAERLRTAAYQFTDYWLEHPDHFRMVFISNDITRTDVGTFIQDDKTRAHFKYFYGLVEAASPNGSDIKSKADVLIVTMIGAALCSNTIGDYPWTDSRRLIDLTLNSILV